MKLDVELLDFDHLDEEASLESERINYEIRRYRSADVVSLEDVHQALADYDRFNYALISMESTKTVSRDVANSLRALTPRYPELESFFNDNPVGMYTAESSTVMFDVSMENWLATGWKALVNLVKALVNWIVNVAKKFWEFLTSRTVDTAKVDAKLDAFAEIAKYIQIANAIAEKFPSLKKVTKQSRDVSIQSLSAIFKQNNIAYMERAGDYDKLITTFAVTMVDSLKILNFEIAGLIKAISDVQDPTQVKDINDRYTVLAKNNEVFKKLSVAISPLMSDLPKIQKSVYTVNTSIDQLTSDLQKATAHLAITKENDARTTVHPKLYDDILAKADVYFTRLPSDVRKAVEQEMPKLLKEATETMKTLQNFGPSNDQVRDALLHNRIGDVFASYNQRINVVNLLQGRLGWMMGCRNATIDSTVNASLVEAKAIGNAVNEIKGDLGVGQVASLDRAAANYADKVKKARL